VNQTNLSMKYNFPAERREIQYETAQRQVERLFRGVPVKSYSGFSRWRGGLDGTQSSTKDSCSFETTGATLLHSSREGGVEGIMNAYSGVNLT
jgi:hypothetical protein